MVLNHRCKYCDSEMEEYNVLLGNYFGMSVPVECNVKCNECNYEYLWSHGSIEIIHESEVGEEDE